MSEDTTQAESTASREHILGLLERCGSEFFDGAAGIKALLDDETVEITCSRPIHGSRLMNIYRVRCELAIESGFPAADLAALVQLLTAHSESRWCLITVSAKRLGGAIFAEVAGRAVGCLVREHNEAPL